MANTSVDGVTEPGLSLIGNCEDGLAPVVLGHMKQEFGRVAGPEHLVYGGEPGRTVLIAEVGSKDAVGGALAPQELACAAGGGGRGRARA